MAIRIFTAFMVWLSLVVCFSNCGILQENSKYKFNDGIYQARRFSHDHVYVLKIDDDTIAVFPVLQFKDSTAILTKQRVNYTSTQRRLRDNKVSRNFYKPSFDLDVMTIPLKYRPAEYPLPNQLTTNFNGAIFGGYRIDDYRVSYKRTPLNVYKQSVKHTGYSGGFYVGIGSTPIDQWALKTPVNIQYEGMLLITGIAANMALERFTIGVSLGTDYLQDSYRNQWIYEGKACAGVTVGLDIK